VSLLFRGGQVVTPEGVAPLDLRVLDGRITEVGPSLALGSERVIDVGGLVVLPGAIDPHGHQWEPGFTPAPDFSEVTASAAFGGVTTFLDHPLTPPTVVDGSGFRAKVALGERTALIDFGLHGGAAPDRLDDLGEMWQAGATGIKLFTCPTGTALDGLDDPYRLRATLERIAAIGGLALVHAEDAGALDRSRADLEAVGRGGVQDFDAWHSLEAELTAVDAVLRIASLFGTPTYIVHASSPLVVDRVIAARSDGLSAWVETCPHYLHLTDADLREQGGWAMTAPPVRDASARRDLRALVAKGAVDTVGGDHCAIDKPGKSGSRMESITPGVPSIDIYIPLLLDLVADGSLDLERLAGVTAARPARIFGLPTKGSIDVGKDADFAIVDPTATTRVRAADLPCSAGWSPYEGRILRGAVIETWSRGERIVREGRIEGRPGRGRFIHRSEAIDA
jgi:allantoinase